jgi:hypothetical protein
MAPLYILFETTHLVFYNTDPRLPRCFRHLAVGYAHLHLISCG